MPVEMFPLLYEQFRVVGSAECQADARAFTSGRDAIESWMPSHVAWYWQTIRDLMLSGF